MLAWLSRNIGSILVATVIFAVVLAIAIKLIRDKQKGHSSCSCGCADCAMSGQCHTKK